MASRKLEIEDHLGALEGLDESRFQSWEPTFIKTVRRDFDRTGDIKEGQFATLESVRGRVAPRKLGRSNADKPQTAAMPATQPSCADKVQTSPNKFSDSEVIAWMDWAEREAIKGRLRYSDLNEASKYKELNDHPRFGRLYAMVREQESRKAAIYRKEPTRFG